MRSPNRLIAYEYFHNYCCYLDREGISLFRSGLELSHDPWLDRERPFFDAFPCPMGCLRTTGRKRNSGLVLVLEHCRKRSHVRLLHFPARSGWHLGVSAEFTNLHSQSNADPEAQIRLHCRRALATPARNWIAKSFETLGRSAQRPRCQHKRSRLYQIKSQLLADRDQHIVNLR